MKREKIILLLIISSILVLTGFIKKTNKVEDTRSNNFASHEVEFKFIGNTALYGTPKDCGIFSPDTVVLKGVLSGNEDVDRYDPVLYTGVLHISIKMAVCNVKRVNGEDQWCTMTVNGDGPVETELKLDTNAHEGYGYIKINYTAALGAFRRNVSGTCDPQEMQEEENNVPNNTIAAIFNGYELRSLQGAQKLRRGRYPPDSGPGGTTTVEVKN
jgi:hypothetical protein